MTVIYLTEYNTRCYVVKFQINGCIQKQKTGDISNDENNIYCLKPLETIIGKSESFLITALSGAFDKSVFDGNTTLLKIIEENDKHRSV